MNVAHFGHGKQGRVALPVSEGLGCSLWGPQLCRHHPVSSGHHPCVQDSAGGAQGWAGTTGGARGGWHGASVTARLQQPISAVLHTAWPGSCTRDTGASCHPIQGPHLDLCPQHRHLSKAQLRDGIWRIRGGKEGWGSTGLLCHILMITNWANKMRELGDFLFSLFLFFSSYFYFFFQIIVGILHYSCSLGGLLAGLCLMPLHWGKHGCENGRLYRESEQPVKCSFFQDLQQLNLNFPHHT